MADKKFSQFDPATELTALDLIPIVQGGLNKKIQPSSFFGSTRSPNLIGGSQRITSRNLVTSGSSLPVDKAVVHLRPIPLDATNKLLPDGTDGQELTIISDLQDAVVTIDPLNSAGFNTITFLDLGSSAKLYFTDGKWFILSLYKATAT